MAINNFKPFALDPNANVTSQADWEALPALLSGFTAGKASSAQVNKAIRQASFIAAALAQYTANKSGLDVLDDGDLNGFISKMGTAFGKDFQALDATLSALAGLATGANKLPYFTGNDTAELTDLTSVGRDIIGKNTIAGILTYLGLGEAAKRNVGTGANQIPDMGSFTLSVSGTGYQKLPSGFILQWGSIVTPGIAQDVVTHFPIAFPNRCLRVLVSQDYTPDSGIVGYIACAGFSSDPVKFISRASTPGLGASFLALGC
ncbi:hypothetical protein ACORCF_004272 [Escherichia coli]